MHIDTTENKEMTYRTW